MPFKTYLPSSLIKKRLSFNFSKVSLELDISNSLFSSFQVDIGTKALLNSLRKNPAINYQRILDLGCGYGPIGLFLKAQETSREVHMVDRDALALVFASHNAEMNNLKVKVYPSLDYAQIEGRFSLIVTNFPAKAAVKGLQTFVYGASTHLTSEGVLSIVIVRELTGQIEHLLDNPAIKVLYREKKKGHSVYHISFTDTINMPEHSYERQTMKVALSKKYLMRTVFGLPEFDSLSYGTRALVSLLKDMDNYSSVQILEPEQGHSAVAIMDKLRPEMLTLASRDLLSLTVASGNVRTNFDTNLTTIHLPYLQETPEQDLVVWNIQRKSDLAVNRYNLQHLLNRNDPILAYGKASFLRKLLGGTPLRLLDERTEKNHCAQLLKPEK